MENVIEVKDFTVKNGDYTEALKLHNEIMANGTIAAQALYELCRCLKRMRDEKLIEKIVFADERAHYYTARLKEIQHKNTVFKALCCIYIVCNSIVMPLFAFAPRFNKYFRFIRDLSFGRSLCGNSHKLLFIHNLRLLSQGLHA